MRDTRRAFLDAIEPRLTQIEQALLEAFFDMRSAAAQSTVEEIVRRFQETRNVEQALDELRAALNFAARGFYAPLDRSLGEAFYTGAAYQLGLLPKRRTNTAPALVVRFDGRRPRAEAFMREQAAILITEISADTEKMIRETLTEATEQNRGYRKVARDLIGTTEGNKRVGGLIGLHSRQAEAVRKARAELEAGDFTAFMRRARRDKRFDRTIAKAIKEGRSLTAAEIERGINPYSDNLLKLRADTIARTEGNKAANAGRAEATVQMIEDGHMLAAHVEVVWDATPDSRTRESHAALNGERVPWGQSFISPITGAAMRWPHDDGAPPAETVNCRCSARFVTDYAAVANWRESRLVGA